MNNALSDILNLNNKKYFTVIIRALSIIGVGTAAIYLYLYESFASLSDVKIILMVLTIGFFFYYLAGAAYVFNVALFGSMAIVLEKQKGPSTETVMSEGLWLLQPLTPILFSVSFILDSALGISGGNFLKFIIIFVAVSLAFAVPFMSLWYENDIKRKTKLIASLLMVVISTLIIIATKALT